VPGINECVIAWKYQVSCQLPDEVWHLAILWSNQQNVPDRRALGRDAGTMAKDTRETLAITRFFKKGEKSPAGSVPDLGTLATAQKLVERDSLDSFLIA